MNKITKTFTYALPDDYLYDTNALGNTGQWTYTGPDLIWVFVDKATNKFHGGFKTEDDNAIHYPTPPDYYKVLVSAIKDPLLATLFDAGDRIDYATLPQLSETLPDGNVYTRPETPAPDHTYDVSEITYDPTAGKFIKPYPWKKPHMDWTKMREWRNTALLNSDKKIHEDTPAEYAQRWEEYRQFLRELPQLHGAAHSGETPTTDPWKLQPYPNPDEPQT